MRREIAESLEKNRHEMEERLQLTKNFDLVERKLKVGDRALVCTYANGFVKNWVLALWRSRRNMAQPFPFLFILTV